MKRKYIWPFSPQNRPHSSDLIKWFYTRKLGELCSTTIHRKKAGDKFIKYRLRTMLYKAEWILLFELKRSYTYKSRGKKTHWYFVTSLLLLSSSVIFPIPIIRKHQLKWILHFSGRDRTDTRPAAPSPWTFYLNVTLLHYITLQTCTERTGQVAKCSFFGWMFYWDI